MHNEQLMSDPGSRPVSLQPPSRSASRLRAGPALLGAALGTLFLLGGCGGGEAKEGAAGAPGQTIVIKDFTFAPKNLEVRAGAKVMVKNEDSAVHTLTADDGSFDTGNLDAKTEREIAPTKPGQIAYKCNIHQYMTGTIQVRGS